MFENRAEAVLFVLSATMISFVVGFAVRDQRWFPTGPLLRAANEAHRLTSPPAWAVPRVYERSGVSSSAGSGARTRGLTLVASHWSDDNWLPGLRLLSPDGEVLHEWHVDPSSLAASDGDGEAASIGPEWARHLALRDRNIHSARLLSDGDVVLTVEYVAALRLDACSRIEWALREENHHTVVRADDGTFWIPAGSRSPPAGTRRPWSVPGLQEPLYHDRMLQVTPEGEITSDIHVLEVLFANGLEHLVPRANFFGSGDLTHLNDIEPLPRRLSAAFPEFEAGDLLVSLRDLNLVMVVDPNTLNVRWHRTGPFIMQHDPDFLPDGSISVFDNRFDFTPRGSFLGGSRVLSLSPGTDSTAVLFSPGDSMAFYTEFMGNSQQLADGHLLLTEAQAGRVMETNRRGEIVWEWVVEPYDESHVPEVAFAARYDFAVEQVAAWPCSPS